MDVVVRSKSLPNIRHAKENNIWQINKGHYKYVKKGDYIFMKESQGRPNIEFLGVVVKAGMEDRDTTWPDPFTNPNALQFTIRFRDLTEHDFLGGGTNSPLRYREKTTNNSSRSVV